MFLSLAWDMTPTRDRPWEEGDDGRYIRQGAQPPKICASARFEPGSDTTNTRLKLHLELKWYDRDRQQLRRMGRTVGVYDPRPSSTATMLYFDIDTPRLTPSAGDRCFMFALELIKDDITLKRVESEEFKIAPPQ